MTSSIRTNPLDLRGRRIFVTGGTGFVGRCLLDYLRDSVDYHGAGTRVTILSRSSERFLEAFPVYRGLPWLDFVAGDLKNLPRIDANAYTDLIHGAADTHSRADAMSWLDQLVDGTRQVLDLARDVGVQRLLFISSGAVYGPQPHNVATLREDHPFAPSTMNVRAIYGHGKRMAEHLCAQYATSSGLECVIARCFAIVSPHIPLDGPYAMGNFLRDALAGQGIQIAGSGRTIRSYIDGRDMAHWMLSLLRWGRSGEAYNVGSDQPFSMLELATIIRDIVGINQPIDVYDPDERSGFSVYLPEIVKAGNLGLRIDTPLREALTQTVCTLQAAARLDRVKTSTVL
jgi:nucleoside-diphosphate-sugar epimerase